MSDNNLDTNNKPIEETPVEVTEDVVEPEETTEPVTAEDAVNEEKAVVDTKKVLTSDHKFSVGDTVKVFYKIVEGDKFRVQPYEGIVIAINGKQLSKTFTVRRIGAGQIGVERIFPIATPNIEKIVILKYGNVRQSKLYYLRDKIGKAATKIKEKKQKAV